MYKKRACTLLVFTQLTNKYWTDQLRPLRGPEENISDQQGQRRQEGESNEDRKKKTGEIDETQEGANTSAP